MKMRQGTIAAAAVVVGVAALSPYSSAAGPVPAARITAAQAAAVTKLVRREMATQKIPGLAIEVAVAGRTVYARGFGVRSPGQPVTNATIFPIGSITKQFTAGCVVLLAEQHSLDLGSPVSRYLPQAPHGGRGTA